MFVPVLSYVNESHKSNAVSERCFAKQLFCKIMSCKIAVVVMLKRYLKKLVITVENTFPLVTTVENTFPLLVTVGKNNGSSFFLKTRGTSEMSSMGHRIIHILNSPAGD